MRIRVVEDDENIATWLVLALEDRPGVKSICTTDSFEDLLSPEPWEDVNTALVDINLGSEMTGIDILRYLKGQHPDIYRIAFTASLPIDPRVEDFADVVLEKPAKTDDIYEAMLRGKRGRS